jgi:hypothetical protein
MNITGKIDEVRKKIISGDIDADTLAAQGMKAMFTGMQRPLGTPTHDWVELMRNFANNSTELDRLCGKDSEFNGSRWGMACLAYIAGNSTCTADTAKAGGTVRSMSLEMIKNLDAEGSNLTDFKSVDTDSAFTNAFKIADSSDIDTSNDREQ